MGPCIVLTLKSPN